MASKVATKNAITLKGSAQIVTEFLGKEAEDVEKRANIC